MFRGLLLGTLWLLAVPCLPAVTYPLRWHWSNPLPHGNNIINMAYSPTLNRAVQVTELGQLYSSDDLSLWTPRDSGTDNALRAVVFFNTPMLGATNRVVITGESGTVLYADDLNVIQPGVLLSGPTSDWLEGVAASPALCVAVGDNGAIYTSVDGKNWKRQNTPFTDWLSGVAWGNGGFIAVGELGVILSSGNGTNWTRRTVGTGDWNRIGYANGRYTIVGAAGSVITSTNGGLSWLAETTGATNELFAIGANNSARLVAGDNDVRLQDVFTGTWTDELAKGNGPVAWTYYADIARQDFLLLAGRTGMLSEGYKTNLLSPYFWIPSTDSVRPWLFDATHVAGLFVAVGDRASVLSSGDGVDWNLELMHGSVTNSIFLGVGGDTNMLVAAGTQGTLVISPNTLITNVTSTNVSGIPVFITNVFSSLGVLWRAIEPRPTTNDLQGVGMLGNLYVVTGDNGTVLTSSDGTNWSTHFAPTAEQLSSVAAFPGGLVATGDNGAIVTSPDGVTWTARASHTTNWLYRVHYFGGQLVAVGQNGSILTSNDGLSWSSQNSGTSIWLHDIALIQDTYFIVGKEGTVLTSTNLINWTSRGTITAKSLYGAATDGNKLIAIGPEGIILRSPVVPDLTPVNILSYGRVMGTNALTQQNLFLFGGHADQRFTLDRSPGFGTNQWSAGAHLEFLDSSGTLFYLETFNGTNLLSSEYYRTTLTP